MLTWKLWRSIKNPSARHPLFLHTVRRSGSVELPVELARYWMVLLLGVCGALTLLPGMLTLLVFLTFSAPFLYVALNGTVVGVIWAVLIGVTIVREREQGTHDLLCISPVGSLGVHWLLGIGRLHRNETINHVHNLVRGILIVTLMIVGMIALVVLLNLVGNMQTNPAAVPSRIQTLLTLAGGVALAAGLYLDHIQSLVAACLVGMIAPSFVHSRVEVRFWSGAVFLLLQVSAYLAFWIVGIILGAGLFEFLQLRDMVATFALTLTRLAIFYAIRETLIAILWDILKHRLNATPSEFELVSRLTT